MHASGSGEEGERTISMAGNSEIAGVAGDIGVEQGSRHARLAAAMSVQRELADLPEGAIVTEEALARMFSRHSVSIKRAVRRGELPPPVRLMGEPVWTVGTLLRHLEARLEVARIDHERKNARAHKLSP
jgi:hypothetical protein